MNLDFQNFDWSAGEDAFPAENENLTGDRRTEARLCVVQALFTMIIQNDADAVSGLVVMKEFLNGRVKRTAADKKLFTLVMDEAVRDAARYRSMLEAQLLEGWTLERIDPVQYALMWAAAAELSANTSVGPKVVLNEFVNIAKGFAKPDEVAFINAAMDSMARAIRPDAFSPQG